MPTVSTAEATIDGRMLPGFDSERFLAELRPILGEHLSYEILLETPPLEVSADTIAQDLIVRVGPSGHYLAEQHTVDHMRTEFVFPTLSDRDKREEWEEGGAKSARQRANERAREILDEHQATPWSAEQEAAIRAELPRVI